jgi:hypothetical protein
MPRRQAARMRKLRLVPRDEEVEARFRLDRVKRVLSSDPIERDAALGAPRKPCALIAVPATDDNHA